MTQKEIIKEMLEELNETFDDILLQFNEETDIEKRDQLLKQMDRNITVHEFLGEKLTNL